MEITDFLEGILNKEEHAGDLLKKDKTYISLGNGNNNILIEYNGLNSYNFKVLDTGDIKLVEGRIEKIKGKSFIRESTIFNIDGSDKLRTVYYKTYKITSSQSKTNLNERNYYVLNCCHKKGGDFSDLIVKDRSYWKNFSPEDAKILKFTRNTKTGEISDFEGRDDSYSELKEARDSMLKDMIYSTEEYNKSTAPEFIIFSCFLESLTSLVQFRIPDFEELDLTSTNTENFIHSLNLKISDNDDPKNFAIVPIMTLSHISLMFIDLRKNIEFKNRIKHLDNSLAHYDNTTGQLILKKEIFGSLADEIEVLSTIKPQFGGCCGILANHNIKQIMSYSEDLDIEKISEKIRSGKFQTRMITDILRDIYNISVVGNETNKTVTINEKKGQ